MESCEFLRDASFSVVSASDPLGALKLLAGEQKWSALITDIDLGPGIDGFEVARRARVALPKLPVVFISGRPKRSCQDAGMEGMEFIAKPFHPSQIVEALDRVLATPAA